MPTAPILNIRHASGRRLFDRDCGRFHVIAADTQPSESKEGRHGHGYAYFSWLIRGVAVEQFSDEPVRWGRLWTPYFHPLGEWHESQILQPSTVMAVRLTPAFQDEIERDCGPLDRPGEVGGAAAREFGRRIFAEGSSNDSAAAFALASMVYELIAAMLRQPQRREPADVEWLQRVLDYLHDHWTVPISLESVAREVNRHPAHLSRAFRQLVGMSPGQKLRSIRLDHARRRLIRTSDSIVAIACACGFYDESHFARHFRRQFGIGPARFRSESRR